MSAQRYFCFHCRRPISQENVIDFTCQFCHTGFIEEMHAPPEAPNVNVNVGGHQQIVQQLMNVLNDAMQHGNTFQVPPQPQRATPSAPPPPPTSNPTNSSRPNPSAPPPPPNAGRPNPTAPPPPNAGRPNTFGFQELMNVVLRGVTRAWNPSQNSSSSSSSEATGPSANQQQQRQRTSSAPPPSQPQPEAAGAQPGGPRQPGDSDDPATNATAFINNLFGGLFPPNATIRIEFNQFSPGGDNMFAGNFEEIISQLLNTASPQNERIPEEDLQYIPKMKVSQERVENEAQCTTCMEMFALEEEVCRLDCDHIFHSGCILPWLRIHNTCPVCRGVVSSEKWRPTPPQRTFQEDELD